MKPKKAMSETEVEIMKVLWNLDAPIAFSDLLNFFNTERGKLWKMQTLSTFLTRLSKNGLVKSEQQGKGRIYWPSMTQSEYEQIKAEGLLDSLYQGSIKNFLAALYNGKPLSESELTELKEWLSDK